MLRTHLMRGFTLVELMVAITLGLFLLIGLISLLVSTVNARTELDKTTRQIDNGRYALQVLGENIQLAGYVGATASTAFAYVAPVACPASVGDLGYTAETSPGTSKVPYPVYRLEAVPDCIDHVATGTAMLLVTRVHTSRVNVASAEAAEQYLQISSCANDMLPFAAAAGSSAASFTLTGKDCDNTKLAPLRKIVQQLYFVSSCNDCAIDTTPTLKVAEYRGGTLIVTPLVEGVENFQVDYGIDMDANGSPDCYTSNPSSPPTAQTVICPQTSPEYDWAKAADNWSNVMAVRVHVLARTIEASGGWSDKRSYDLGLAAPSVGPFNDNIKRHVHSTVARLYNASGQREAP
ncbi:MAG TPA: PilW family protein [Variovorax sp.]|nr:PilW family protein [Variovorax sp.]